MAIFRALLTSTSLRDSLKMDQGNQKTPDLIAKVRPGIKTVAEKGTPNDELP